MLLAGERITITKTFHWRTDGCVYVCLKDEVGVTHVALRPETISRVVRMSKLSVSE